MSFRLLRRSLNIKRYGTNALVWNSRYRFCSQQKRIKKPRRWLKWLKRGSLGIATFVGTVCGIFYIRHRDEENWRRSLKFWRHVYPIYLDYKIMDIRTKNWDEEKRDEKFQQLHEKYTQKIVAIIEDLRGLYIKMGQLGAANIANMYPKVWVEALRKFEDDCPFEPMDTINDIICKDYGIHSVNDMFSYIDPQPLGAASIGQVHHGKLLNGKEVVIKIQYPEAEKLFRGDLLLTRKFCEMAQPEHLAYIDEMEAQFLTEFDYKLEAENLELIGNHLNNHSKWSKLVVVPKPIKEFCTKNCLVMDYIEGPKLITALYDNFNALANDRGQTFEEFVEEQKKLDWHPTASELKRIESQIYFRDFLWNSIGFLINNSYGYLFSLLGNSCGKYIIPYKETVIPLNIKYILDIVASVHGYQLFISGAFNGDPHPGNILLCPDGRIGLIDYGQVKQLDLNKRIELAKLLIYIYRNDSSNIISQVATMGLKTKYNDPWVFEKVGRFYFDSDDMDVTDGMNMLLFMEYLEKRDPQLVKADDYVFPARLRMLISGLHWSLGYQFSAAKSWNYWCKKLLKDNHIDI